MNLEAKPKRTNEAKIERATLSKPALELLKKWKLELEEKYQGLLQVTLSDLVNAVLEAHEEVLTEPELNCVKNGRLTELQKAKWIYETIKKAEKDGTKLEINELISKTYNPPKIKKIRRKKVQFPIEKSGN